PSRLLLVFLSRLAPRQLPSFPTRRSSDLERAADLPERLRRPVELGVFEAVAADHRFDLAGGIIDGEQSALWAGLLFELDAHGVAPQFLNGELRQVADLQQFRRFLAAGPGKITGRKYSAVGADFDNRVPVR